MGPETTHGLLYKPYAFDVPYAFDAGSIHYLGKWEGVGPWKSQLFGPQMALEYWLDAISQGAEKSQFPGDPIPLPLSFLNGCCPHQKHYARGRVNHRCINH